MSKDVDFIMSEIKTIVRPEKQKPLIKKEEKKPQSKYGSYQI